ncbi:c-type cytochrome [Massilia sp. S19_KUP03_FR1]|uniref:c-type cytochrome n=1 Tax=Massilia sp. S19_KUP03_FR1 TaxID=3025503 RepID=UPI002FCDC550
MLFLSYPIRAAERPAVLPDTLAQRLIACTACHAQTDQARGTDYFPRIGGKPAGYLYNQLTNFRDGRRQYPVMTYMVTHLPDAYLHEIAGYFAAQHPPAPPAVPVSASTALLERGRVLAMQGDAARKVPACVACHGQALAGTLPTVPGLVGLPRDYVNAQFGAWRNRTRQALLPDCMATIAARLSLDDINAVSTWLASQPYAPGARPATTFAGPLPLACGSVP